MMNYGNTILTLTRSTTTMNIDKMKKAAEKLIAAEGRKETLAALSGFAQVCGPEEVLELIRLYERTQAAATAERDTARQQAATLRSALAAVFGTDDLIALEVLKANYKHSGPTHELTGAPLFGASRLSAGLGAEDEECHSPR